MAANGKPPRRAREVGGEDSPNPRRPGQLSHLAYAVDRRIRGDEVDGRTRLGRRVRRMRLRFALSAGYATWTSTPAPLQEAIRNAVRLALFAERLFNPFWRGSEVPRAFLTASENLRRALGDIGLEPVELPEEPTLDQIKERLSRDG